MVSHGEYLGRRIINRLAWQREDVLPINNSLHPSIVPEIAAIVVIIQIHRCSSP